MARVLAVTRLRVAEERKVEYLAVLTELERLGRARGRHLWVFQGSEEPNLLLEFSESASEADHRAVCPATGREADLEARRRALVTPEGPTEPLWRELPLPSLAG